MDCKNGKMEESPGDHHRFFSFPISATILSTTGPQIVLVAAIVTTIHHHTHWSHTRSTATRM